MVLLWCCMLNTIGWCVPQSSREGLGEARGWEAGTMAACDTTGGTTLSQQVIYWAKQLHAYATSNGTSTGSEEHQHHHHKDCVSERGCSVCCDYSAAPCSECARKRLLNPQIISAASHIELFSFIVGVYAVSTLNQSPHAHHNAIHSCVWAPPQCDSTVCLKSCLRVIHVLYVRWSSVIMSSGRGLKAFHTGMI